jgi:peptidyl-prolyl cis-trans isomerase D
LRQAGLSERGFLNLRRQDELRAALVRAFIAGQTIPKPLFNIVHAYNDEKRVLEWIKIDPDAITVAEPTEAKLKEVYDSDKAKYMTPEYRKVEVLVLDVDQLKKGINITDDEIAKQYEATKASYNTPEKRRIQQIAFKDKEGAEAALKALRDGSKTFGDIVKEVGAKASDVDLGLLSKKQLIDPKVAEVAFSLEKDKYSDVVEGRFATVILRVTQIVPGVTRTLADVKDEVKDKLATEQAKTNLQNERDEVDDKRLAGKTLKEISDELKLPFTDIPAMDSKGLGPDGKPVMETPYLGKIIAHVFSPEGNADDMSFDLAENAFAWTNVISTEPPKQKTFDQVKDEVKSDYMRSERHRLTDELAKKLADRVNAGEPVTALEDAAKNKAQKTEPVTRKTVLQSVSESVVEQAFSLPKGKASFGPSPDGTTDLVYRVVDIIPAPAPTLTETDALDRDLQAELANQTLSEYTDALRKRYGASINQAELNAAVGVSEQ